MSRDLSSGEIDELEAAVCRPALFFEGVFDATTVRIWNGARDVSFGGNTFLGNGWLNLVKPAPEIDEIRAAGISVELSFLPPTVISIILNSSKAAGTGKLWLCMMSSTWAVIGSGYLLFSGKIDQVDVQYAGEGARVEVRYESILAALLRPKENRYSDQNQRLFYPDDAGMQYVVQATQWTGYWGRGENKLRLRRRDRR